MNQQERDLLADKIVECAYYYGKNDLTKNDISLFINILNKFYNLEIHEYINIFDQYMFDVKNKTFPNASSLRAYTQNKKVSSIQKANEVAQRIFGSIKKFGYTKPNEARNFIGEEGWKLIQNRGGWYSFCESTMDYQIPTLTAQFRDTLFNYFEYGNISDEQFFEKIGYKSEVNKLLSIKEIK